MYFDTRLWRRCVAFIFGFCCSEVTVFESFVTLFLDRWFGEIHLEQAGSRQGRRGRRGVLRARQAGFSQGRLTPGRASEEAEAWTPTSVWHFGFGMRTGILFRPRCGDLTARISSASALLSAVTLPRSLPTRRSHSSALRDGFDTRLWWCCVAFAFELVRSTLLGAREAVRLTRDGDFSDARWCARQVFRSHFLSCYKIGRL